MRLINILIAENAKLLSNIISTVLRKYNYNCTQVFSLKEIKTEVSIQNYDYIILNLYLPDAEEKDLIINVRKLTDSKVIVLTSKDNDELRDYLFKYGIIDYLNKENIELTIKNIDKLIRLIEENKKSNILIIEDSNVIRAQEAEVLRQRNYNVFESDTGKGGIKIFNEENIDLVILDLELNDMNGLQVLEEIKRKNANVPVLIVSGTGNATTISKSLKNGASDFMRKPIIFEEFLLKTDMLIDYFRKSKELEDYKNNLEVKVKEAVKEIEGLSKEIEDTQKEVVFTIGAIVENRSKETGNHVNRVAEYSKLLALYYGLSMEEAEMLKQASPMHDIGKVAIPDAILNKPGKFDDEERKIMDSHAQLGYQMLKHSNRKLLKAAAIIAYEHHEKWNGKGYPRGLKGKDIHIYGRITALADVFDALGSNRCYKDAWTDEEIFDLFKEESGEHFDPKLVDIFFQNLDEFLKIRDSLKDKF
ncbi:MAG: response regulator [Aliarcobacter sp.]|nr:response regulator [Aliarcobacter sp.]